MSGKKGQKKLRLEISKPHWEAARVVLVRHGGNLAWLGGVALGMESTGCS